MKRCWEISLALSCIDRVVFDALEAKFSNRYFDRIQGDAGFLRTSPFAGAGGNAGGHFVLSQIETAHIVKADMAFKGRVSDMIAGKGWPTFGTL